MTALHFLCWHERIEAGMLRLFLENTGSAALTVRLYDFSLLVICVIFRLSC